MTMGIYLITCIPTNTKYVGRAIDVKYRFYKHKSTLKNRNRKCNNLLLRDWHKYGEAGFDFKLIEEVPDRTSLPDREQHWINYFNTMYPNGYNFADAYGGAVFTKESTKRKISEAAKKQTRGEGNPRAKLLEEDVIKIKLFCKENPDMGNTAVARILSINNATPNSIYYIRTGKTWSHIKV